MTKYIIRRLLLFIPTLILVTAMVFAILRIMPGDVAALIVTGGGESGFNERAYQQVRSELHLDEPVAVQYLRWVGTRYAATSATRTGRRRACATSW